MAIASWFPVGFALPDGSRIVRKRSAGSDWQILVTAGNRRALVAEDELANRWIQSGLIASGLLSAFEFAGRPYRGMSGGANEVITQVSEALRPESKSEALAFALSLKATREIDGTTPLQDAIYVERLSRLLPTYSISSRVSDDVLFGFWLTGGVSISAASFRRLRQNMSWLDAGDLRVIVEAAGLVVTFDDPNERAPIGTVPIVPPGSDASAAYSSGRPFYLPGRSSLTSFINEHIVDVVSNKERYASFGIGFPAAVVLQGPPGCGKSFAVDQLISFFGWPSFQIDALSVASPYIHETSRKIAEVFSAAMDNAPSVLVIDEMEAFLANREGGVGQHRVEEVAEFLRRIPEASKKGVLVLAMTNRIDMVDPAILRRGRFDHILEIGYPTEAEVKSLLDSLLSNLPTEHDVDSGLIAGKLAGRPLSDTAFVVREAARLAARGSRARLDQGSLNLAVEAAAPRDPDEASGKRRIGFV